jgi:hypothetical protein
MSEMAYVFYWLDFYIFKIFIKKKYLFVYM